MAYTRAWRHKEYNTQLYVTHEMLRARADMTSVTARYETWDRVTFITREDSKKENFL